MYTNNHGRKLMQQTVFYLCKKFPTYNLKCSAFERADFPPTYLTFKPARIGNILANLPFKVDSNRLG